MPVFLYEAAARSADRRRSKRCGAAASTASPPACASRRGSRTTAPATLHPTAGAIAIGARGPLVAWNLVLDRPDLPLARHIARTIRTSSGGLPCLKALGLALEHTGQVQVSMNLTDYRTTSMADVYRAVDAEAHRAGADIADSEIIGLVPRAALDDLARRRAGLRRRSHRRPGARGSASRAWVCQRLGPADGPMRVAARAPRPLRLWQYAAPDVSLAFAPSAVMRASERAD